MLNYVKYLSLNILHSHKKYNWKTLNQITSYYETSNTSHKALQKNHLYCL